MLKHTKLIFMVHFDSNSQFGILCRFQQLVISRQCWLVAGAPMTAFISVVSLECHGTSTSHYTDTGGTCHCGFCQCCTPHNKKFFTTVSQWWC